MFGACSHGIPGLLQYQPTISGYHSPIEMSGQFRGVADDLFECQRSKLTGAACRGVGSPATQTNRQTRDVHPTLAFLLGQRRIRWANIKPTLGECLVLKGKVLTSRLRYKVTARIIAHVLIYQAHLVNAILIRLHYFMCLIVFTA